jgi:hypothetical protein
MADASSTRTSTDIDEVESEFTDLVESIDPNRLADVRRHRSQRWVRRLVRKLAPPKASGVSWA